MANETEVWELPAGTCFKWRGNSYVVSDTRLTDVNGKDTDNITNGFIKVQEITGLGTPHSKLGEPVEFHADIKIERPSIFDWLNS